MWKTSEGEKRGKRRNDAEGSGADGGGNDAVDVALNAAVTMNGIAAAIMMRHRDGDDDGDDDDEVMV